MKRFIHSLLFAMSFIILSCSNSTSPSEETPVPQPKNHYYIDVKSQFTDKKAVTGAKNGLIGFIKASTWASVTEVNENYELWVKNPHRTPNGSQYNVTFTLELKKSTLFGADLVKSTQINKTYDLNMSLEGAHLGIDGKKFVNLYKEYEPLILILCPTAISYTNAIDKILPFVNILMVDNEDDQQKAESIIVGSAAYRQTMIWFNEIEKGK